MKLNVLMMLSGVIAASLITGCGKKPEAPKPVVVEVEKPRELKPAMLVIDSNIETKTATKKKKEEIEYTVQYMNNTDNSYATISLKNVGDKVLKINGIKFINDEDKHFKLTSGCSDAISAHKECMLHVWFNAEYAGEYKAMVQVLNDTKKPKANIDIIAKAINLKTAQINPYSPKVATIDPRKVTELKFYKKGDFNEIKILNDGVKSISLDGYSLEGDATKYSYTSFCPKTLAAGENCTIRFNYIKKDSNLASAYFKIKSDAIMFPSNTIKLLGKPRIVNIQPGLVKAPKILVRAAQDEDMILKVKGNVATMPSDISQQINNIEKFQEDFSKVKHVYYYRIIYQNANLHPMYKKSFEEIVKYNFQKNGYKLATTADQADKIVNIYPKVEITKKKLENGSIALYINADVVARLVTKSATKSSV